MRTRKAPKHPLDHNPEAVTHWREQAGLTRTQLAAACGVSKSLITEIEKGTRNATPPMLNKLAEILKVPRAYLERKSEPQTPPATDDPLPEVRRDERTDEPEVQELPRATVRSA